MSFDGVRKKASEKEAREDFKKPGYLQEVILSATGEKKVCLCPQFCSNYGNCDITKSDAVPVNGFCESYELVDVPLPALEASLYSLIEERLEARKSRTSAAA